MKLEYEHNFVAPEHVSDIQFRRIAAVKNSVGRQRRRCVARCPEYVIRG
jgi:hypothetical protein